MLTTTRPALTFGERPKHLPCAGCGSTPLCAYVNAARTVAYCAWCEAKLPQPEPPFKVGQRVTFTTFVFGTVPRQWVGLPATVTRATELRIVVQLDDGARRPLPLKLALDCLEKIDD